MTLDEIFVAANAVALAGWLALAAAPWRRSALIAVARLMGVVLAVLYLVMFINMARGGPDLDFEYTIAGIGRFFSVPGYVLVGWIHYLAFDLWIGAWEAEEAPRAGVPHAVLLPCLFLTFVAGPVGLLAFLLVRAFVAKRRTA